MEKWIFVDTNVLLKFYISTGSHLPKLLTSLQEVRENLFVTDQIVDEIARNRSGLVRALFRNQIDELTSPVQISVLFDQEGAPEINKKIDELGTNLKALKKLLGEYTNGIVQKIAMGEDDLSKQFEALFVNVQKTDADVLMAARERKERGNPPGKRTDPLGDQISWEILLRNIGKTRKLWIVTADSDYWIKNGSKFLLNPILFRDLMGRNPSIEIYCSDNLGGALDDYSKHGEKIQLPSAQEMEAIKKEEKQLDVWPLISGSGAPLPAFGNFFGSGFSSFPPAYLRTFFAPPDPSAFVSCPVCGRSAYMDTTGKVHCLGCQT